MVVDKHSKEHKEIRKDLKEIRSDVVNVEKKVDGIMETLSEHGEILKKIPTKEDFPELLKRTLEWATLKTEHELIKKILRDRLKAEI
ncbi:MAG: hypothetical protein Q8Q97_02215 [bacterium]|nr:hypothetical protein [bacterium]